MATTKERPVVTVSQDGESLHISGVSLPFKRWDGSKFVGNLVYVFWYKNRVVYAGSTNSLFLREYDYKRQSFKRDEVYYLETATRGEAYDCEFWLTDVLEPKYNTLRRGWQAPPIPFPPYFVYGQSKPVVAA